MKNEEFSWLTKSGQKIFARSWQPEQDPRAAIMLIHGLGEHTGRYANIARRFCDEGFSMTGFDLPGHGCSDGPRGNTTFDKVEQEIEVLIQHTESRHPDIPRFLYGQSMGGLLIMDLVLKKHPDLAGTIVTSPNLGVSNPVPGWKYAMAKYLSRLYPSLTLSSGLDKRNLANNHAVVAAYDADPLVHDRVTTILGWEILTRGRKLIERASHYPVPLLLMVGSDDRIISLQAASDFAQRVPQDRLVYKVWEGMAHEIHNELDRAQVVQTMIDWISQRI